MGGNWDGSLMGHLADTLNAEITDVGVLSQELSGRCCPPGGATACRRTWPARRSASTPAWCRCRRWPPR
ncbi:hypothetical protein ACFQ0B_67645 [Nonomuraea thailandensis]